MQVDLDYSIPDAPLTALGRRQSAALPAHTPNEQGQVDVILSSGLKRTLQSTLLGWGPAVQRLGLANVVVLPQLQGELLSSLDRAFPFLVPRLLTSFSSTARTQSATTTHATRAPIVPFWKPTRSSRDSTWRTSRQTGRARQASTLPTLKVSLHAPSGFVNTCAVVQRLRFSSWLTETSFVVSLLLPRDPALT